MKTQSIMRRKDTLLAMVLAISAFAAPVRAQSLSDLDPPEALIKAARAEGAISIYSSMNEPTVAALLNAFEKRYGVKGSGFRAPTAPLVQRFALEFDGKGVAADVFSVASTAPFNAHPEWFAPLDASFAPNLANWPQKGVHANRFTWDNQLLALAYNTDEVKPADVPHTWTDMLAPRWKGRIVLSDPRAADNYMGWLDAIERAHGVDYLHRLAALDFKLTPSGASGVQLVAAGAMAMNFPTISTFTVPLVEKKAPIAVVYPTGPGLASGREVGVVSAAPHPNAARLFVNWTLSAQATKLYCSIADVPVVGDPDGKLGCVPSHNVEQVNFEVKEDRARVLTRELGIGQ